MCFITCWNASRLKTTCARGSKPPHVLWFVVDSDITNGGFHQLFSNSSGDFAEEAKRYLKEIGATSVLGSLNKASGVFPGGVVPADRDERNRVLEEQEEREREGVWDDWDALNRQYYQAQPELYRRLLQWVQEHRTEFPDP